MTAHIVPDSRGYAERMTNAMRRGITAIIVFAALLLVGVYNGTNWYCQIIDAMA